MGGGGHHTTTNNVHNISHENTVNENNNHSETNNQYNEENTVTEIQDGDRVLGGQVIAKNDLNTGTAIYSLQNLLAHQKHHHSKKSHSSSKGKLAILLV